MNELINHVRVTMQPMEQVIRALDDLKQNVLPNDPQLFAVMSEAPLDDLNRLRSEMAGDLRELNGPSGARRVDDGDRHRSRSSRCPSSIRTL